MRPAFAPTLLAAAVAVAVLGPAQAPTVVLAYRAASEDDASRGILRVELTAGRTARVVVWERDCGLSGRRDAAVPPLEAVDQYWTFQIDLAKDERGRPAARVRYRLVKPAGPGPDQDRLVLLDGRDVLAIEGFSARTDCRYDRIHLSVSGA